MEKQYSVSNSQKSIWTKTLLITGFIFFCLILFVFILLFLATTMPGTSATIPLPPATAGEMALAGRLRDHVRILATDIGRRNEQFPEALDRAADYITAQFGGMGYTPVETRFGDGRFRNISVTVTGSGNSDEIIVIGAHYDSRSETPGADDNASGVSALLEIARGLSGMEFQRSVRFISFPNEERPHFGTDLMGSRVTAMKSAAAEENIIGMLSLEMLGYYTGEPGTQEYPPVIGNFYPDTGNFIAFISNMSSRPFLQHALGAFRERETFPSEGMAAPEALVSDIRRSDNASYWDYGFPAVMVTDTSNFRNPNYHTPSDTPGTLDYDSMSRLVEGLTGMVITLANTVE